MGEVEDKASAVTLVPIGQETALVRVFVGVQVVQGHVARVSSAMIGEVRQYLDSAGAVGLNLVIQPSALDGMLDTLLSGDLVLPPGMDRDEISPWLVQRLAHLVVSARWGQAAGIRWRYRRDIQISAAAALLRRTTSPTALVASVRWSTVSHLAQAYETHAIEFPAHHTMGPLPD